jgi:hypothetical protein
VLKRSDFSTRSITDLFIKVKPFLSVVGICFRVILMMLSVASRQGISIRGPSSRSLRLMYVDEAAFSYFWGSVRKSCMLMVCLPLGLINSVSWPTFPASSC